MGDGAMMDREGFERWLAREARRIDVDALKRKERGLEMYLTVVWQEWNAPPASPEVEVFCADLQQQWRKK